MRYPSGILLAAALVLAAGCSKSTTKITSDGDNVTVKRSSDGSVKVDVDAKSGEKMAMSVNAKGVALPADFPKDYPLPLKAVVVMASVADDDFTVGVNSPGSVDDTVARFQADLGRAGWQVEQPSKRGKAYVLQATKGPLTTMLLINNDGQGGSYTQLVVPKGGR